MAQSHSFSLCHQSIKRIYRFIIDVEAMQINMQRSSHTYIHTYMYIYLDVRICVLIIIAISPHFSKKIVSYTHKHTYANTHIREIIQICLYAYIYIYVMYVCISVCVHVYVYMPCILISSNCFNQAVAIALPKANCIKINGEAYLAYLWECEKSKVLAVTVLDLRNVCAKLSIIYCK